MPDNRFCKKLKLLCCYLFAIAGFMNMFIVAAEAQMFGTIGNRTQNNPLAVQNKQQEQPVKPSVRTNQNTPKPQPAVAETPVTGNILSPDVDDEEPESQESEDRNADKKVVQIRFVGNDVVIDDKPKILLYMRDFKILRNLDGKTNCSMRFFVLSSASEKITNLSFRLKWPKMETALAFDDVMPNVATYFDYALIGNGCYSMDTPPNIIVNRCRIKGLSQRQCADAIQWIK